MNSDHLQNTPGQIETRKAERAIPASPRAHVAVSALNTVRAVSAMLRRLSVAVRQKFGKQSRNSGGLSQRSAAAVTQASSLSTVPGNAKCAGRGTSHE